MRITDGEKPPTARGAATRDRIIDAASTLLRRGGVAATSLDAVLQESATSKSQFYHYFADKDALMRAVIRRQADHVRATHDGYLSDTTTIAGLRRWRNRVVELTRQTRCAGGCPLGSLVSELAETRASRVVLDEGFAQWQAALVVHLRSIDGRTTRKATELKELALVLLAALQGGLLLAQATRTTRPLELALDAAIDHVTDRLSPNARPGRRRPRR